MKETAALTLGTLLEGLALGENKRRQILDLSRNLARRREITLEKILQHPELETCFQHKTLSPADKYKKGVQLLKNWLKESGQNQTSVTNRRPYSRLSTSRPKRIWIEAAVRDSHMTRQILERLPEVPFEVVEEVQTLKHPTDFTDAKKQWLLAQHKGKSLKTCQAKSPAFLCCNYWTLTFSSNCPLECSYCILQSYLKNNPITTIYTNMEEILGEVTTLTQAHPKRRFRIGTGELADSLAMESFTGQAAMAVEFFANLPNAVLELKTKSVEIETLLSLEHKEKTVISWSVNPEVVIASEEFKTASLTERLKAAERTANAGYGIGFHFDPIVIQQEAGETWLKEYQQLLERILDTVPNEKIRWISFGALRFPADLKQHAEERFPKTKIYTDPAFQRHNGKFHYAPELRQKVYETLWPMAAKALGKEKLYLCMEPSSTWKAVDPEPQTNEAIESRLLRLPSISAPK